MFEVENSSSSIIVLGSSAHFIFSYFVDTNVFKMHIYCMQLIADMQLSSMQKYNILSINWLGFNSAFSLFHCRVILLTLTGVN